MKQITDAKAAFTPALAPQPMRKRGTSTHGAMRCLACCSLSTYMLMCAKYMQENGCCKASRRRALLPFLHIEFSAS